MNNLMNTWKTPWSCSALDDITIRDCHDELNIAEVIGPNVRAHIVACVNACDGIDTDVLAGWTVGSGISVKQQRDALFTTVEQLRAERDALLVALEAVLPYAITRGEDLEEAKAAGNEDPAFPGADKCTAACEAALKLLAGKQPLPAAGVELVMTREQAQALATALDYDLDDLSTIGVDIEDDECYTRVKEVRALLKGFGL